MIKVLSLFLITGLLLAACTAGQAPPSNPPPGENNATPTPGSMAPTNPEAAHMMEPISAPNVQPAAQTQGGQPLAYREENGVKVFELSTQAVRWPILDGVFVTAYTYNGTVPAR
jgi:hypothetical protein